MTRRACFDRGRNLRRLRTQKELSQERLSILCARLGYDLPRATLAKIEAGASLLQLYTGLIYAGPALIGKIKTKLIEEARRAGPGGLASICGRAVETWASKPLA